MTRIKTIYRNGEKSYRMTEPIIPIKIKRIYWRIKGLRFKLIALYRLIKRKIKYKLTVNGVLWGMKSYKHYSPVKSKICKFLLGQ